MNRTKEPDTELEPDTRLDYSTPSIRKLGAVAQLTLGGSNGAAEDGSSDETEQRP